MTQSSFAKGLGLVAAVLLLATGCSFKSDDRGLLPWLRKHTRQSSFGALGTSVTTVYETRYFGFWHRLDADGATVLDKNTVALHHKGSVGLLHRGERQASPVCAPPSLVGIPPYAESIDCTTVTESRGRIGAARIEWKRTSARGEVSAQAKMAVEDERHVLLPKDLLYDEQGHPYFLSLLEGATYAIETRSDCALIGWRDGAAVVVARLPAALTSATCRDEDAWYRPLGVRLFASGELPATRYER